MNINPIKITVCIPAYKEDKLLETLKSLSVCFIADLEIKVSILINGSQRDSEEIKQLNKETFRQTTNWIRSYSGSIIFECYLDLDLPIKDAGVGLARKILGDKAANENGIIVYLDADCTVSINYFQEIYSFFKNSKLEAASLNYEHELNNLPIIEYESHLRYFLLMQKWLNLPYCIPTIGSSMAVTSSAYIKKGGMNKRKAGEDFYFLQKFIKDQTCGIISTLTVYPSGRTSDRVPFGTGRAMLAYTDGHPTWLTYNPNSFIALKPFFDEIDAFYEGKVHFSGLENELQEFLLKINAEQKIKDIIKHIASKEAFKKRFYQFFDAFQLMKCLHYLRETEKFKDIPIQHAVNWYFENILLNTNDLPLKIQLLHIRKLDLM